MKSYHILECPKQHKIADLLYGYYVGITAHKKPTDFWNHLTTEEIKNFLYIDNNPCRQWFEGLGLKIRDISYTITNDKFHT